MPPKPKFTREEIVSCALELVSKRGVDALTARELGTALGSSARPIFTVFENMEELRGEVRKAAMLRYESYITGSNSPMPLFKQVGMQMVLFGSKEPKLYQLLFMQENRNAVSFNDIFEELGSVATDCVDLLCKEHDLTVAQAKLLFENVWVYTFGIGTLCATRVCNFSEKELSDMLTTEFNAMLMLVKSGNV